MAWMTPYCSCFNIIKCNFHLLWAFFVVNGSYVCVCLITLHFFHFTLGLTSFNHNILNDLN